MTIKRWLIAFCLLLSSLPSQEFAAPAVISDLQIAGAVVQPTNWSAKEFRRQFGSRIQTITYTRRGVKHSAKAVSLWEVLQAAQPKVNPQIKNHLLQFTVLMRGRDGYTVAFSLPELSPDFGQRLAWLALDEDGKPPGEDAGPVELIVPDDKKAGRWVHAVTRITVVDEAQASTAGKA